MDRGLQLLLLLILAVVAIGNCLTFDSRLSGSKNSRRNHKYPHLNGEEAVLSAAAAVAVAATADYHPDYLPQESISQFTTSNNNNNNNNNNNREEENEYRGGKLIGKWRSTGEAIEPKWRDGDSVPLVPFEEAATRRKVPKPREKTNPFNINYSDNFKESGKIHQEQEKVPVLNFPLVITDKPVDSKFYQNGGIPTPVILKTPQLPVAVPVTVPLNHEPITNKLHELHLAKLRYLNIPLTNINLPIPEIISSSEITPHNYYYTTDENNNNNLRNGNKRYRTRKPKPVTKLPEEDLHTSYVEQTIQTSLSTTPITTPTLSVTTSTTPISTTITTTTISISSSSTSTTTSRPTTVSTSSSANPSTLTPTEKTKQVTRTNDWVNPFGNKNEYELNDEEYQRPRPRKRRPPSNYEFQVERNRELDSERRRNRTKVASSSTSAPIPQEENSELKSLLKMQQVEGNSLSEVLQRKNLSLSDLLKRKAEVISALKSKDYEADSGFNNITSLFNNTDAGGGKSNELEENGRRNSTVVNEDNRKIKNPVKESNERRWRRPFRRNKLRVNSRISTSTSTTTTTTTTSRSPVFKEEITDELDKKKLTQESNERKYNEKLSTTKLPSPIIFPRLNTFTKKPASTSAQPPSAITTAIIEEAVPAEETTNEERSTTTQPDNDEIMEFSDFSTIPSDIEDSTESGKDSSVTERIGNTIFAKFEDLTREVGSTLSIEHILTTQPPTKPTKVEAYADDKSNNLFESDDYQNDGKDTEATTLGFEDYETGRPGQVYERIISKMEPEVRAEIFELISTGSSAKRLEDILSSRNMSIDELIALRQRGSSQVHLAELSRIRPGSLKNFEENESATETSDASDASDDKMEEDGKKEPIVIDLFDGKPDEGKKPDVGREVFDLEDLLKAFDSLPFGRNLTIDGEIVEKVSTVTSTSTTESLKYEVRNAFDDLKARFENVDDNNNLKIGKEKEVSDKRSGKNIQVEGKLIEQEIGAVEEIIHQLETLEVEKTPEVFNEEIEKKTLSRVRPSIIASGTILGLTIVGFLVIFIVCRIKQKQRYRYKNSFTKTVFQAPAINRKLSNSSSLNTIMVNVVATSTTKRTVQQEIQQVEERFDCKSDIDNDSLDANDSWETIPDFMK